EYLVRLQPEHFVQEWAAMLERRCELDGAGLVQLAGSFVVDDVVRPVWPGVDGSLLVVELRIEQDQPRQFVRTLGGVVAADATAEAGTEEAQLVRAGGLSEVRQTDADVAQDGGKRQRLLSALAVAMPAKIDAKRGDADIGQTRGQAGEEAALLAGDAPAVYQQDGTRC